MSYLEKEDVLNCAGSLKSEGLGATLLNRMEGKDPNSLMGLPTIQLIKMLAKEKCLYLINTLHLLQPLFLKHILKSVYLNHFESTLKVNITSFRINVLGFE